jgi:hypothetical protein
MSATILLCTLGTSWAGTTYLSDISTCDACAVAGRTGWKRKEKKDKGNWRLAFLALLVTWAPHWIGFSPLQRGSGNRQFKTWGFRTNGFPR